MPVLRRSDVPRKHWHTGCESRNDIQGLPRIPSSKSLCAQSNIAVCEKLRRLCQKDNFSLFPLILYVPPQSKFHIHKLYMCTDYCIFPPFTLTVSSPIGARLERSSHLDERCSLEWNTMHHFHLFPTLPAAHATCVHTNELFLFTACLG